MNHSVYSDGRTSKLINRFSNHFIDVNLLLDIRPSLKYRGRTCDHNKSPKENIHIDSCSLMFRRIYTLIFDRKYMYKIKAWLDINKRNMLVSVIELAAIVPRKNMRAWRVFRERYAYPFMITDTSSKVYDYLQEKICRKMPVSLNNRIILVSEIEWLNRRSEAVYHRKQRLNRSNSVGSINSSLSFRSYRGFPRVADKKK